MAETKKPFDFVLQAADDLLANTPVLVALVKAEALGHLWEQEEPQPGLPNYFQQDPTGAPVMITNEGAMRAFEEMIRAALALAAAREKHVRSIKMAEDLVSSLLAEAHARKKGAELPAVGSFHG